MYSPKSHAFECYASVDRIASLDTLYPFGVTLSVHGVQSRKETLFQVLGTPTQPVDRCYSSGIPLALVVPTGCPMIKHCVHDVIIGFLLPTTPRQSLRTQAVHPRQSFGSAKSVFRCCTP